VSFAIETLVRGVHKDELEGGEYHVALALAYRADDTGYCWPSLLLIAQDAHVTERTVLRSLQRFTGAWSKAEPRSLITKKSHRKPVEKAGGRSNPTGYQFNVALLRALNDRALDTQGQIKTKDRNTDTDATNTDIDATSAQRETPTSAPPTKETPTITPPAPTVNTDNDATQTPTSGHETPTLTPVNIGRTEKELKEELTKATDKGSGLVLMVPTVRAPSPKDAAKATAARAKALANLPAVDPLADLPPWLDSDAAPRRRYVLHWTRCSQEDDQLLREGRSWLCAP
jgi:hypothetical protein